MSILKFKGELEVDVDRGVIYFHNEKTGLTVLRVKITPELGYLFKQSYEQDEIASLDVISQAFYNKTKENLK